MTEIKPIIEEVTHSTKVIGNLLELEGLYRFFCFVCNARPNWNWLDRLLEEVTHRLTPEPCGPKFIFNNFSYYCKECGWTVPEHDPIAWDNWTREFFTIPEEFRIKPKESLWTNLTCSGQSLMKRLKRKRST